MVPISSIGAITGTVLLGMNGLSARHTSLLTISETDIEPNIATA